MTPGRRQFLEDFIARMEARAAERRRSGTVTDLNIADTLEHMIARDRAELAAAPAPAPTVEMPIAIDPDRVTWKHPVFNAGGRFNPFAGTYAQAMLASADVCDRIGRRDLGDGYRALATRTPVRGAAWIEGMPEGGHRRVRRSRSTWSGPNCPPPEPVAFVAGEQIGLAL